MKIERENCPMRHENGNCMPAGGFCTAVNDEICEALHNAYICGESDIFKAYRNDVMPVEHGRWLTNEERDEAWCSLCSVYCGNNYDAAIEETHYCPNCGAKMDLEE